MRSEQERERDAMPVSPALQAVPNRRCILRLETVINEDGCFSQVHIGGSGRLDELADMVSSAVDSLSEFAESIAQKYPAQAEQFRQRCAASRRADRRGGISIDQSEDAGEDQEDQ